MSLKYNIRLFLFVLITGSAIFFILEKDTKKNIRDQKVKFYPSDYFYRQRAYPDDKMNYKAYFSVLNREVAKKAHYKITNNRAANTDWQLEGPRNIGGRINSIAVANSDKNILYVGSAQGGIFKTIDGGTNWFPIFDDQAYLSIGDIAIDLSNDSILYVGTGDPALNGKAYIGNGVYKSMDAGNTWHQLGLEDMGVITEIIIDSNNTNILYAATMGIPYKKDNNRGLYKSVDAGNTWTQILFISDSAGVTDIVMDPLDHSILYAVGWNRIRNYETSLVSGLNATIFKTINGGNTWTELYNGLPTGEMSRISLAISSTNPNKLYAAYVDTAFNLDMIYKSMDGGNTWTVTSMGGLTYGEVYRGFGWYFGNIELNPKNDDEVYLLAVQLWKSTDGSDSWNKIDPDWWLNDVHADKHDLVFNGSDSFLLATDGGLYQFENFIDSTAWQRVDNIPNSQLYRITVNPHENGIYYGGLQDNGTTAGNRNNIEQWPRLFGGDGFKVQFHPTDSNIAFCETQWGGLYLTKNNFTHVDEFTKGIDQDDRINWDMPYLISNHNPDIMYAGTHRLYVNTNSTVPNWLPISSDLTKNASNGNVEHSISTISESPLKNELIYVGTTDGNVWTSNNAGRDWQKITAGLPNRYITSIKASPNEDSSVYVTLSGYKDSDNTAHVFKSENYGKTWKNISGNLPHFAVNNILIHPLSDSVLFIASDGGVYGTLNEGTTWTRLGNNFPIIVVSELDYDQCNRRLIAATYARSVHSFPLDSFYKTNDTCRKPMLEPDTLVAIGDSTNNQGVDSISVSEESNLSYKIYPNPVVDESITILSNQPNQSIDEVIVYNLDGSVIRKFNTAFMGDKIILDVRALPAAEYILKIKSVETIRYMKLLRL